MKGEKDRGEENKLFYTGKALKFVREIWQIHKVMLMKRSVFDQRLELPYS